MKLYGLNNIVRCGSDIYYIEIIGERLHLKNETSSITLDDDEKDLIEDVEMSEWLLDALFTRKYYHDNEEEFYWDIGTKSQYEGFQSIYTIEKDDGGLYYLMIVGNNNMCFDTVRELQNAYHFYSDYDEWEILTDDIDTKLKKLFKLI